VERRSARYCLSLETQDSSSAAGLQGASRTRMQCRAQGPSNYRWAADPSQLCMAPNRPSMTACFRFSNFDFRLSIFQFPAIMTRLQGSHPLV